MPFHLKNDEAQRAPQLRSRKRLSHLVHDPLNKFLAVDVKIYSLADLRAEDLFVIKGINTRKDLALQ
jgi:hypothetical protein